MITHYEDFEVIITNYGDQLQAQLGAAPGGRNLAHPIPITLPDDHIGWAEAKQGRKPEADLAELGHQLFKSLITGELADNWNACLGEMRQQPGTGLRLRFSHEAEVLNEVPLELLCTRTNPNREFLALDMRTPVVRSPRSGNPVQKRSVTLPLRMLVVIANPRLQVQTDSAAEQASLEEALHSLLQAKKLQVDYLGLESRSNTDYLTLQSILAQARPPYDVVHFIGHGALPDAHDEECEGALLFVDPQTDRRQDVRASDLVGILAGNGVRVAVLQACDGACPGTHNAFQGVAQRLIAGGLPAAVAMQCKVDKDVATCFCGQLYRYWLTESGLPLERAVTEARQALRQQFPGRASAWWTPVLFIRLESIEVLKVSLNEPPATEATEKVRTWDIQTYLDDLTQVPEYARWADQPYVRKEDEDHYIQTQSKILPLFVSPFDEDVGRRREDLLDVIHASDRLLILGEPGVGKTAALERIMWETANANGPVIPIYVPLSYYEGDLIAEVWGALEVTGVLHLSSRADVGEFLRQNQCLVLFDGLNEVRGDQRQQIAREIAEFVRAYRRHRYVITSRSQDQLWRTLREGNVPWNAVVVQRITDGQVREYLIAHLGPRQGKETHDSLNKPLHAMSQTPLFLWMLKEVRVRGGELPGNRGELFDQYVEKAVFTRDEGKLEISIPRSAKRQALAHLASSLQGEHRLTCREEEAVAIVSGKEQEYDPRSLIHEAQIHGLLKRVERKGEQQICFMHQSVQEYFVALTLRDIVASEVDNPAWQQLGRQVLRLGLAARASDPWWAESFVQLAGLTEYPSWLARAVAKVSPWLAFWCMIEGREIDEETRSVVETGTVDLLRSHDVKERQKAVRELEILENPRTAEYMVTVLGDEAEEVVNAAVRGLGKLGEPAAEYLHPHLERNTRARRAAIRALGLIWEIHPLTDLGGDNANLRLTALKALGQLGDTRVIEAVIAVARWDTDMTVRRRAVELLGQLGDPQSVGLLTAVLEDAEPSLRASAAIALGHIRDKRAVEPLTEALKDDHEVVQRRAIRALGKIWGLSQLERLSDDQVFVRLNAVAVLGQLADPRVVQPLIAALKDKGGAVCAGAAKALGQLGDTRALTPLISVLLTRDEPAARKAAAEALGKLGDRQAVEPLIAALRDQEREVQRSAAAALGLLRDKRAVEHLIAMCGDRRLRESAAKALAEIGRLAIPSLIASLQNEEEDVRASAAIALGQIGGAQALEALLLARKDDDVKVRTNVAAALGQIGGTQALEALVTTLREDRDSIVRAYAATSLGQIGGEQASEALTAILEDEDEDETVWQMAIGALGRMWSLPQLVRLSDEDAVVRQDAAAALGQLGDKRAIKPLLATLRDPDEAVRHQSISALGQTWDLPQLVRLGDHDAKRRQDAAMSLGQLGDIRAVEPLIATLRDSKGVARN